MENKENLLNFELSSGMDPYIECIIFPGPFLEYKYVNKYRNQIILIPTKRKNKYSDNCENIPCFFEKNPNSNNILIYFIAMEEIFTICHITAKIYLENTI